MARVRVKLTPSQKKAYAKIKLFHKQTGIGKANQLTILDLLVQLPKADRLATIGAIATLGEQNSDAAMAFSQFIDFKGNNPAVAVKISTTEKILEEINSQVDRDFSTFEEVKNAISNNQTTFTFTNLTALIGDIYGLRESSIHSGAKGSVKYKKIVKEALGSGSGKKLAKTLTTEFIEGASKTTDEILKAEILSDKPKNIGLVAKTGFKLIGTGAGIYSTWQNTGTLITAGNEDLSKGEYLLAGTSYLAAGLGIAAELAQLPGQPPPLQAIGNLAGVTVTLSNFTGES